MHGQYVWYELMTPDVEAARKFYSPFTGWGTQAFDPNYTMWTTKGVPFGGIARIGPEERQRGIPPSWMPYIESTNVDETARLATSLGGKVLEGPRDIPNAGRYAVVQDPQGATFGVYKSSRPSQSWDGTPVPGRFSWHELMTTDYRKAFDFYQRLFGWEKTGEMDMGGGNAYFMYGKGKPFGGIFNRHGDMAGMRPFWLCYIFVNDLQKAFDAARLAGAQVQRPPMDIPGGGRIAILGDPQGAAFALHEERAQAAGTPSATAQSRKPASQAKGGAKKKSAAKKSAAQKGSAAKKRSGTKKRPAAKKRGGAKKGAAKRSATRPAAKKRRR